MRSLMTGMRSEKRAISSLCERHTVYAIRYSLLLLGYKPVQHVTVLNTVGNCNTVVSNVMLLI